MDHPTTLIRCPHCDQTEYDFFMSFPTVAKPGTNTRNVSPLHTAINPTRNTTDYNSIVQIYDNRCGICLGEARFFVALLMAANQPDTLSELLMAFLAREFIPADDSFPVKSSIAHKIVSGGILNTKAYLVASNAFAIDQSVDDNVAAWVEQIAGIGVSDAARSVGLTTRIF